MGNKLDVSSAALRHLTATAPVGHLKDEGEGGGGGEACHSPAASAAHAHLHLRHVGALYVGADAWTDTTRHWTKENSISVMCAQNCSARERQCKINVIQVDTETRSVTTNSGKNKSFYNNKDLLLWIVIA